MSLSERITDMSGFRLSRRTVLAALAILERLTQAKFSRYLLELGPQYLQWVGAETLSVTKRINNLMQVLDQIPDRVTDDGEPLREKIVMKAISLMPALEPQYSWQSPPVLNADEAAFVRAVEMDGYAIADGKLRRTLPLELDLPQTESELVRLLKKHALQTTLGHLDQALDAHGRGDWAAANGQMRTFFDSLLDEIVVKMDSACSALKSGQQRRSKLAGMGFLSRDLNEWDDNGLGFLNGLIKRLHPQGAHPGLSDESDSTFRLHVVLLTTHLLLARYDASAGQG